MLLVVGVTGGIGSGKTAFAKALGRLGCRVIDADAVARKLVDEREDVRKALRRTFGPEFFDDLGRLRRRALGQLVFSGRTQLERLNRIVWPVLVREIKNEMSRLRTMRNEGVVVVDMAVLYETGLDALCDKIVVVDAPLEKRIAWLVDERGWRREEITARIRVQMGIEEKKNRADVVVENSGTLEVLYDTARCFFEELREGENA